MTAALKPLTLREQLLTLIWQAKLAALSAENDGVSAYSALRSLYQDLQEDRPIDHVEMVALLTSCADRL